MMPHMNPLFSVRGRLYALCAALLLLAAAGTVLPAWFEWPAGSRLAALAAAGVAGLVLTAAVLASIMRPLRAMVKALRLLNSGETTIELPPVTADEFGDMSVALRQFRDQAERLRRLAFRDPLTGTGNRGRLEEALRESLDLARQDGTCVALFYLDLDNFRSVNDSLGHSAGDRYLSEAALRLQRFLPEEALLCRYGGDKFGVLLSGLPAWDTDSLQSHLRSIAGRALSGLSEPCQIGADLLPMSASIGIAVYPTDGQNGEQLVSSADAAMFLAKRQGRNNAQFASPELTGDARRQLALVGDIRRGLERNEFETWYQPVVDVDTGRTTGVEALLRWNHPHSGILNASEFIAAAEASGLIHALDELCLRQSCEQAARWQSAGAPMRISVNLSARQIEDRTALSLLQSLHGRPGARELDLEITETAILRHLDRAQETLRDIRALGHRLSVDDFGTGYSSLVYLQRFPINRIKIDRSFVARVESSREAQAIIAATVALGRSLDLEVVGEGVETAGQLQQLRNLGCTLQQGYYFTAALPAGQFEAWRKTGGQALAVNA